MRPIVLMKLLLGIGLICVSITFLSLNTSLDKSINEQYTALSKLKNDPNKDSSENRKTYRHNKSEINKNIETLTKKRYARWYQVIAFMLIPVSGWLMRNSARTLFRKRAN
jgi:hypothetical protein